MNGGKWLELLGSAEEIGVVGPDHLPSPAAALKGAGVLFAMLNDQKVGPLEAG